MASRSSEVNFTKNYTLLYLYLYLEKLFPKLVEDCEHQSTVPCVVTSVSAWPSSLLVLSVIAITNDLIFRLSFPMHTCPNSCNFHFLSGRPVAIKMLLGGSAPDTDTLNSHSFPRWGFGGITSGKMWKHCAQDHAILRILAQQRLTKCRGNVGFGEGLKPSVGGSSPPSVPRRLRGCLVAHRARFFTSFKSLHINTS